MQQSDLKKYLPLTPAIFQILLALLDGEQKHGYKIMQTIAEQSGNETTIVPTTLYRSAKRMLEQKLIIETDNRPDPELDDERRRYYQITSLGRLVYYAERERLERQLQIAVEHEPNFGGSAYGRA